MTETSVTDHQEGAVAPRAEVRLHPLPPALRRVTDAGEAVLRLVCIVLFSVMIVAVFFEVVMRYVFNAPTFWSEALARSAMVWLVLLGMAVGIRHQEHIRVDFLISIMPRALVVPCAALRYLIALAFAVVMMVYGVVLAVPNWNQSLPGLEIPVFWVYLSVPVASAMMVLFLVELIWKRDARPF
jgi:TRAP-type transport system small permease protein